MKFSKHDFEKILLGLLFALVVIVASIKYFQTGDVTEHWTEMVFILGGFFTTRKIFSYFKKEQIDNSNNKGEI